MRSLRLSLAHAAPRCTQEGQTAETKTEEEVNVQPGNRQGLVFEIVHSTSPSSSFLTDHQPHCLLPYPLLTLRVSTSTALPQVIKNVPTR